MLPRYLSQFQGRIFFFSGWALLEFSLGLGEGTGVSSRGSGTSSLVNNSELNRSSNGRSPSGMDNATERNAAWRGQFLQGRHCRSGGDPLGQGNIIRPAAKRARTDRIPLGFVCLSFLNCPPSTSTALGLEATCLPLMDIQFTRI